MLRAVEEYAAECSVVKVYGSEVLDFVVDEGVQIHGGYGFHQDYEVEKAYRDSRINRIFEGTNEINRLLIPAILLKRAARGRISLVPGKAGAADGLTGDANTRLVLNAKQIALMMISVAVETFGNGLDQQQETVMNIADIIMETFAMESALLRREKLGTKRKAAGAMQACDVFLPDAMARIEIAGRNVLGSCVEGSALLTQLETLRKLVQYTPVNASMLRRSLAAQLCSKERYSLV